MNRHAIPACLLLSALLGAAILPPAQAGGAVNKCIDGAGRVTLTDQACDAHTVSSTIAVSGTSDDAAAAATAPLYAPIRTAPLRQARWQSAAAPHAALSGDMATLKQARIQLMLRDAAPRNRLAALDR